MIIISTFVPAFILLLFAVCCCLCIRSDCRLIIALFCQGHDDAGSSSYNKNECDLFFNNPDLLKYDLASLKDKVWVLFINY